MENDQLKLCINNLAKTYSNGVQALKNISLTIPKGMYGLLGPNGAGKSTLMRTLATLQEPDKGSITLGDIDVLKEKDRVRQTLGYLPQEFGVYPKARAEELLNHFAILKGITDRKARKEVVEALLKQTNLFDVRRQKLGGFSGGMKQRFGVAVALLGKQYSDEKVEVLLVSLDFADQLEKVENFLKRKSISSKVWLLDESDANSYIDLVDTRWSGAIPMTLLINTTTGKRIFLEKELSQEELEHHLKLLLN